MGIDKIGILVSGRGSNLQAIIENVEEGILKAEIGIVISDIADAPALQKAEASAIETMYIDPETKGVSLKGNAEEKYIDELKKRDIRLVCLAGFMRIVKKKFINAFSDPEYPSMILNIHPSLLPSFKGLHAQKQAWEYGVKFTGCTVHFVTEDVDGGPIIKQSIVPVLNDDTPDTLAQRILKEEHKIYSEAISLVLERRIKIEGRRVLLRR